MLQNLLWQYIKALSFTWSNNPPQTLRTSFSLAVLSVVICCILVIHIKIDMFWGKSKGGVAGMWRDWFLCCRYNNEESLKKRIVCGWIRTHSLLLLFLCNSCSSSYRYSIKSNADNSQNSEMIYFLQLNYAMILCLLKVCGQYSCCCFSGC